MRRAMDLFVQFLWFLRDIYRERSIILDLTRNDFRAKYLGSYLGLLWAFIHPLVMIVIFWFVFQVGFKSMPVDKVPFILWLITGIIPWFFFSEAFGTATNSVTEKSYLVQKVVFRVSSLPIVKILMALTIHIIFIFFIGVMFLVYGYRPDWYYIQVVYYAGAMVVLLLGLSWITSSLVIFLKDVGQIVSIILQFGFWLTPIFWNASMVPPRYRLIVQANPVYYLVQGYRNSFIYHRWFWEEWRMTLYYWAVTLIIFVIGAMIFRRLRPHFADVI